VALSRRFRNFHTASQQRPIRSDLEHQQGHEEGVKADDDPVALIYAVREAILGIEASVWKS
jgi:hypothetical protein